MKTYSAVLIVALTFLFSLVQNSPVRSQSIDHVSLTVEPNICGNGIVEPPVEDCEGQDLNTSTCQTLGFSSGHLSCDIACSFDTTLCVHPSHTPTPSPHGTSNPASAISPDPSSAEAVPTPSHTVPIIQTILAPLPAKIRTLLEKSGLPETVILTSAYVETIVSAWIEDWRQTALPDTEPQTNTQCDINNDSNCNLMDLSVILYYVDR